MKTLTAQKTIFATAIAGVAAVAPVTAQGDDPGGDQALETVVVVGQATNSLVTTEQLRAFQANDVGDIFRLTPSVSVGGSLGIAQKIYVRGLEDNYVNVTVDGAPQTSTLFHHIGRVSIDPSLLEQVEVQAGAGEATSGAGAIGGAIRFRTKDVNDLLGAGESFGGEVTGNYYSNDGERYALSLYGRLSDNWGVLAHYSDTERDNFNDGDGDEVLGTASDQSLGFVRVSGNITANQSMSLSYENRDEEAEFSARPNWHVQPGDLLYPSEAERETWVGNYHVTHSDALNLDVTLYDTVSSFQGGRFDWFTEISTYGFDIRNVSRFGDHTFTYGVDYRDDEVISGDPLYAEEAGSVFGAYLQIHSQLTDQLLLSYGVRYDDYEFKQRALGDASGESNEWSDSDASLNVGLAYALTDEWSLGLGYAQAMRGKEIGDGFTLESPEDAGAPFDPDLKPETVTNIEASAEYAGENLGFRFALFDSEIENAIFDQLYGGPLYENAGTVETSGFEIEFTYRWDNADVYVGYSDVDSEFDPKEGFYRNDFSNIALAAYEFRHLGNSRGNTWNLGMNYLPVSAISTGFNVTYVEELQIDTLYQDFDAGWVPSLYELTKDSYVTVDVFAEWQATDNLTFNLAVINLFDKRYRDHSSVGDYSSVADYELVVGPWESGQDVRLAVSYAF